MQITTKVLKGDRVLVRADRALLVMKVEAVKDDHATGLVTDEFVFPSKLVRERESQGESFGARDLHLARRFTVGRVREITASHFEIVGVLPSVTI